VTRAIALTQWPVSQQFSWPSNHYAVADDCLQPIDYPRPDHNDAANFSCTSATPFVWLPPDFAPAIVERKAKKQIRFGCCAPFAAIGPDVLDVWADILLAQPEASLTLFSISTDDDIGTRQRLAKLLLLRDVEQERVRILPRLTQADMLVQLAEVDILLDTFPCSLGILAMPSLWMGTPVLTQWGPQPWQQSTAYALSQLGLTDWIATDREQYVNKATEFGKQQDLLADLRVKLRPLLAASDVCSPARFATTFQANLVRLISNAQSASTENS
jgi:predicted O-linked N-acetylglucosamine transferase (SPINDLY family)